MLPLDQKKKMLTYIRDKRQRKNPSSDAESAANAASSGAETQADEAVAADPALAVKADPYLQMLQRRSLRSSSSPGASTDDGVMPTHPNSAYVAPAEVPHYAEAKKPFKPRWHVAEEEFYDAICACGVNHDSARGKKDVLLHTISSMMSTFGDSNRSCVTAAEEVQGLGTFPITLVEIFEEEAVYYGRWREFRGETKHEENELEDVEEEELAEELDLFAVSETDAVFNEAFLVR
ncbi:hypothetical protein BBJ28_00015573 [Nothophytophthora sp. Chile5]|nr:hypothetical protein BBJ28_00015573 [Nothophytophthora sp. Chile5]